MKNRVPTVKIQDLGQPWVAHSMEHHVVSSPKTLMDQEGIAVSQVARMRMTVNGRGKYHSNIDHAQ